jgi:hypothetical protein
LPKSHPGISEAARKIAEIDEIMRRGTSG